MQVSQLSYYRKSKFSMTLFLITFCISSVVTSPLYVIATSMQLSVIPHLTLYGDVKPEQIKKSMGQKLGN